MKSTGISFAFMLHTKNPTARGRGELDEVINVALTTITTLLHVDSGKNAKIHPDDLALLVLITACLNLRQETSSNDKLEKVIEAALYSDKAALHRVVENQNLNNL